MEEGGDRADSIGSDDEWRRGISRREVASTCAWWGGRGPVARGWGSLLASLRAGAGSGNPWSTITALPLLPRAARGLLPCSDGRARVRCGSTGRDSGRARRDCDVVPVGGCRLGAARAPICDGLDSAEAQAVRPNLTGPRRHALPPGPDTARGPQRSGPDKSGNICCEIIYSLTL